MSTKERTPPASIPAITPGQTVEVWLLTCPIEWTHVAAQVRATMALRHDSDIGWYFNYEVQDAQRGSATWNAELKRWEEAYI